MISTYLTIFSILSISLIIFYVKKRGKGRAVNNIFFWMMLPAVLWLTCANLTNTAPTTHLRFFFAQLGMVGPLLFAPLFAYFCLHFPKQSDKMTNKNQLIKLFLPIIPLFFLVPTHYNIESLTVNSAGITHYEPGVLFSIINIVLASYVSGGLWSIKRKYKNLTKFEKKQVHWFSASIVILVGLGLTTNSLLPEIFSYSEGSMWGPSIGVLVFTLMTSYAIARFELMETSITLGKKLILAVSVAALVVVTALLATLMMYFIPSPLLAVALFAIFFIGIFYSGKHFSDRLQKTLPSAEVRLAEFLEFHFYKPNLESIKNLLVKSSSEINRMYEVATLAVAFHYERSFYGFEGNAKKRKPEYVLARRIYKKGKAYFDPYAKHENFFDRVTAAIFRIQTIEYVIFFEGEKYTRGMIFLKRSKEKITDEKKSAIKTLAYELAGNLEGLYEYERIVLRTKIMAYRQQREADKR